MILTAADAGGLNESNVHNFLFHGSDSWPLPMVNPKVALRKRTHRLHLQFPLPGRMRLVITLGHDDEHANVFNDLQCLFIPGHHMTAQILLASLQSS